MINELCEYDGERWNWTFSWRRALFLWEEELVVRLRDLLATVNLLMEDDGWKWVPDPEGVFSVKSTYLHLVDELRSGEVLEDGKAMIFDHIWDSPAPSKVIAFSWQLLHDRIPTRSNLAVRGILVADVPWECVGCVGSVESSIHLFLHCPSALKVWYDIFRWLGLVIVIPPSLFLLFEGDEELVISFSLSLGSRSGDGIGNLARVHPTVLDLLFWTVMELVV
ncbi:unnamed protein product [Trifolium pratense]|uniref:Uncharacterized protein n=1 Tax=Trifolium pratense TaxID=57577 RepID=A0ACB0JEG8_TRIPR|nr:unnamed protein product [Trifolium pratense]